MITCVAIPYFAAAVEQRDDDDLSEKPLVIGGPPWENRPLFAYSRPAAQRGVRPGMSLRRAHFVSPQAHFLPAAEQRYAQTATGMGELLRDFSDRIEPEPIWEPAQRLLQQTAGGRLLPARYYLDLDGLPLREALPLLRHLGRTLRRETQLAAAVGVASDRFTAQVAASLARPGHLLPVAAGGESLFLADRPVSFLPLPRAARRRLRLLGVRTLGQLAGLPDSALPLHFGPQAAAAMGLALASFGDDTPAAIPALDATSELQAARGLPGGVADRLQLETALLTLAEELAADLLAAGRAAAAVELRWESEAGAGEERQLLRRPVQSGEKLQGVALDLLARAACDGPVTRLSLRLSRLQPAEAQQLSLFQLAAERGRQALTSLANKYGAGCFYQPLVDHPHHPLPERRFQLTPLAAPGAGS
jgi:nucleotidyltransferase/DNA polymerase involved in DNA repair